MMMLLLIICTGFQENQVPQKRVAVATKNQKILHEDILYNITPTEKKNETNILAESHVGNKVPLKAPAVLAFGQIHIEVPRYFNNLVTKHFA